MTQEKQRPALVSRYLSGGKAEFLPVSQSELVRTGLWAEQLLDTFPIAPGRFLLIASLLEESGHFLPLEMAATARGLKLANADASPYEGARVRSITRLFDVGLVVGVNGPLLDSLEGLGHSLAEIFQGATVLARPDAYDRLSRAGVLVGRWIDLGPAWAAECGLGVGAHIDPTDWAIALKGGTIRLSSTLPRLCTFDDFDTGVPGTIVEESCMCGLAGPRIIVS